MSGARDVCTWCMHVWCPCLEEGSLGSLFGGDQIPLSPCEAIVWCVCIVAPPAFARLGLLDRVELAQEGGGASSRGEECRSGMQRAKARGLLTT